VFFVFGGRDASGEPLDVVQKYYPETYGVEDMFPILLFPGPVAQYVNNQTDIWSNRYTFPDWDWLEQEGNCVNLPIVPERPPMDNSGGGGSNTSVPLNPMAEPLYGHAAVTVESLGNLFPSPVWPESPYCYVFITGGINDGGVPIRTMRWFNAWAAPAQRQEDQPPTAGDYSEMPAMPVERAYHDAIVILPDKMTNRQWKIVVFGGFDRNGNYISQVDEFTFDSIISPTSGSWRTLANLPESAAGVVAGWQQNDRGFVYHQMGGRTVDGFTSSVYDVLANGTVSVAPTGLIPRGWTGGSGIVAPNDFFTGEGKYFVFGGLTELGMNKIVERYQPQ
jgi:hypothetical protein